MSRKIVVYGPDNQLNFIKNNNYELSNEMEQESFDKFLNHLKKYLY